MNSKLFAVALSVFAAGVTAHAVAAEGGPQADFLFVGSYHMDNPGSDANNTRADDVLAASRQQQIDELADLLERYRPTKVMVEADVSRQAVIDERFQASCRGSRALSRNEVEQLGFRIACRAGLRGVHAVDWNELGPIRDEHSIDYVQAVERHGQQPDYEAHRAISRAQAERDQAILDRGTVRDMLVHLNSPGWLAQNARAYYRIGRFGTGADPIGANWLQLWYGRNVAIFNNIARHTAPGDRVLVIYGAGHGNHLRQLASDSGVYRVQDPGTWLSGAAADGEAPRTRQGDESS